MSSRIGVLSPLRNREFRLLAIGNLTALAGSGFFRVALAVQVLAISGSDPGAIAAVALAWALGQIVTLPVGGWAGDRFARRRVLICADAWRALMMGGIGALSVTGNLELWHMMTLGAGFGVGNGFANPAGMAFLPELVADQHLTQANSFLGIARPAMVFIVGPLLGGLLITATQPGMAFVFNCAALVVSLIMLVQIRPPTPRPQPATAAPWRDIAEGFRFVVRTRWAWPWLLGAATGTLMFHGPFDVLVPYTLAVDFGMDEGAVSRTMAYILAAGGLGSILVGTALGQWGLPRRFITTLYVSEALGTAALLIFGLMQAPWQAVVAGGVLFTLFAVTDIIWTTTMQRFVPRHLLGRVASLDWLTSVSLAPVSFAVAWALESLVGARPAMLLAGVGGTGVLLALLTVPGARDPELGASAPVRAGGRWGWHAGRDGVDQH